MRLCTQSTWTIKSSSNGKRTAGEFVSPLYLLQKGRHSLNHLSLPSPSHLFSSEVALRLGKQYLVDLFEIVGFGVGAAVLPGGVVGVGPTAHALVGTV